MTNPFPHSELNSSSIRQGRLSPRHITGPSDLRLTTTKGSIRLVPRIHHRGRLPHSDNFTRRQHHCQVRNMGYSRPGAIQVVGSHVLSKCQLRRGRIRHHAISMLPNMSYYRVMSAMLIQVVITRQGKGLGQGAPTSSQRKYHHRTRWQQARLGYRAA